MRVHVTGCKGFIAQHLIPNLRLHGHQVWATDIELPYPTVMRNDVDAIVHLGAVVGRVRGSVLRDAISLNTESTASWAEWCRNNGVHLLYISSSEVYGPDHMFKPPPAWTLNNLYAVTKAWGEDAVRFYLGEHASIARLSMPYGPGHPPGNGRAALTNFLCDAWHGHPLQVHKDAVRSWLWVGDCVEAIRLGLEGRYVGAWNVARSDNEMTMFEVARQAIALCASGSEIVVVETPEGYTPVKRLAPDFRLVRDGWVPTVGLQSGMRATLEWLREEGYVGNFGRTTASVPQVQ